MLTIATLVSNLNSWYLHVCVSFTSSKYNFIQQKWRNNFNNGCNVAKYMLPWQAFVFLMVYCVLHRAEIPVFNMTKMTASWPTLSPVMNNNNNLISPCPHYFLSLCWYFGLFSWSLHEPPFCPLLNINNLERLDDNHFHYTETLKLL